MWWNNEKNWWWKTKCKSTQWQSLTKVYGRQKFVKNRNVVKCHLNGEGRKHHYIKKTKATIGGGVQWGSTIDDKMGSWDGAGLYCPGYPLNQPRWGCNLGAMGTDERTEVTTVCPSAGERVADWNRKHTPLTRNKRDGIKDSPAC